MLTLPNPEQLQEGVRMMIKGMGFSDTFIAEDQHLKDTPGRVARAWLETFVSGYSKNAEAILQTQFIEENYQELIVVKNIPFYSTCVHHLVPFFGTATIGYIPDKSITGLSKLARIVDMFARRLQIQERLTSEIAQAIEDVLKPKGVGVIITAEHLCMTSRGARSSGSVTTTSRLLGCLAEDPESRSEFLELHGR